MVHLTLEDAVAKSLEARAVRQGLSLESYLHVLSHGCLPSNPMRPDEFDAELDKLASPIGGLPDDFSRADIYLEHD
jgi:hypothetical protein